jgi:COP9 signalosome complex subunit 7
MYSRASMTSAVLANLDGKINSIAADTAAIKLNQQEHERVLQLNLKDVYDKQKEKSLGGAMSNRRGPIPVTERENMMMDVDEPDSKGKNRKYVVPVYSLSLLKF